MLPGLGVLALVLALSLGPVAALLVHAGTGAALGPADWAAVRFTLLQSFVVPLGS